MKYYSSGPFAAPIYFKPRSRAPLSPQPTDISSLLEKGTNSPILENRDSLIVKMDTSSDNAAAAGKSADKFGSQLSQRKDKKMKRNLSKPRKFIPSKFNSITQSFVD